jgi:hypothetical protein
MRSAAAETITGQNEQPGSDATVATSLATVQMPAEAEKIPNAALNLICDPDSILGQMAGEHHL